MPLFLIDIDTDIEEKSLIPALNFAAECAKERLNGNNLIKFSNKVFEAIIHDDNLACFRMVVRLWKSCPFGRMGNCEGCYEIDCNERC